MRGIHPLKLDDIVRQAGQGLLAHRLRATLSSIGIIFGVATVVAALAVGEGARREAVEQVGGLGIDNVLVRAVPADGDPLTETLAPALTLADAEHLRASVSGLAAVSTIRTARTTVVAASRRSDTTLVGASIEWASVAGLHVADGRWLMRDDVRERRRVVVLGDALARGLFGDQPPLGRRITAAGDWYQVVGVLSPAGAGSRSRRPIQRLESSGIAIVPFPAMDVRLGVDDAPDRVEEIGVRTAGAEEVESAAAAVAATLALRHPRDGGAYEIVVPRELLRARLRALRAFNAVLLGIGGLALLISGIGIMNIMLASVVERTAEIGVRRAFGATRRAVVAQFAMEAGLLCGAGGVAGVLVGVALAGAIALAAGWPVSVSPGAVLVALALAAGVGLVFGIYPARLASRLDPAEALRAP